MIQKDRTLIADDGMVLTNGSIFAYEVSLGDWDRQENYWEVPEEWAAKIQAERDAEVLPAE